MAENPSPPEPSSTSAEESPAPARVPKTPLELLHQAEANVLKRMAEAQSTEAGNLPPKEV